MRLLNWGGETRSFSDRGWTESGAGATAYVGSGSQRQSPNGLGGLFAAEMGSSGVPRLAEAPDFAIPAVQSSHRVAAYYTGGGAWEYRLRNGGATIAHVTINDSGLGLVRIYVNGALKGFSAAAVAASSWHLLTVDYLMLTSGGLFEVFLDSDQTTPIVTWTGDTDPTVATDIETVQISGEGDRFDDIAIQNVSMRYDGGTGGVAAVGETVTGTTTSVTAVITAIESGSSATAGRLILRSVSGVFQDNEPLTTGGTFVAVNNAPAATTANPSSASGLDTNSGKPSPHGYILLVSPDGAGAHTECAADPAVANYLNVDDWATGASDGTTTHVNTDTTGDRDFYTMEDVDAGFTGIESVESILVATKQSTVITNIEAGIRPASTEYYGPVEALAGTFGPHGVIFDLNPEDSENWTPSDVNASQAGFKLTT